MSRALKQRKLDTRDAAADDDVEMNDPSTLPHALSTFQVDTILGESVEYKKLRLLGHFSADEEEVAVEVDGGEVPPQRQASKQAIVILEKMAFDSDTAQRIVSSLQLCKQNFENDIYSSYLAREAGGPGGDAVLDAAASVWGAAGWNAVKVDVVYPCTERHVAKYSAQRSMFVRETVEMYRQVHLPVLEAIPSEHTQWVRNILAKEKEAERLLFEDPDKVTGFMLHPDQKWEGSDVSTLYCLVIAHRGDVRSLRDLTPEHLPMLRNIRDKSNKFLAERYGLDPKHEIRAHVHYPPSYYHFHVHFTNVAFDAPGKHVGRAHLLDDVIENIEHDPTYYQTRSLTMSLLENRSLGKAYRAYQQEQE